MESKERRKEIEDILKTNSDPQKGHNLAERFGVTRQVIVKDIAILRAEGKNIIATPEGYIMPKNEKSIIKKVIATLHRPENIEDELYTIVEYGGIIEDVIVEHALYGEIKGMLMIKSSYDIKNFMKRLNEYKAEPLLVLTGGVHLHTICAENHEIMDNIVKELRKKGYIISE
jgi:uncharacterized protein